MRSAWTSVPRDVDMTFSETRLCATIRMTAADSKRRIHPPRAPDISAWRSCRNAHAASAGAANSESAMEEHDRSGSSHSTEQIHMSAPARILIVEDQYFFRLALRTTIEARRDMQIVGETDKGEEAITLCRQLRPDVVIMTYVSGLSVSRQSTASTGIPGIGVLVLSNYEAARMCIARSNPALAYLTKDAGAEELVKRCSACAPGAGSAGIHRRAAGGASPRIGIDGSRSGCAPSAGQGPQQPGDRRKPGHRGEHVRIHVSRSGQLDAGDRHAGGPAGDSARSVHMD